MLKRSTRLLVAALHQTFFPLRKELLVNATCMALSITLAVFLAKFFNLPAPYWAGISAMIVVMPTLRAMFRKALMRLFGTYLGALLGLLVIWLGIAHHPWLFFVLLFASIVVALLVIQDARYPYAWLIGGITCNMVMLVGFEESSRVVEYAHNRCLEITLGSLTSVAVYCVIRVLGKTTNQIDIKEQRRRPLHALAGGRLRAAVSGGLAGCAAVALWMQLHLTGIDQSITSVWVLAFSGTAFDTYHKGVQRFGGCVTGGAVAALLMLLPTVLPVFLLVLFCFCLISCIIQNGPLVSRYFGMQAAFAFLIVYANNEGPEPAMFRLLSILNGLILVFLISFLINRCARYWSPA